MTLHAVQIDGITPESVNVTRRVSTRQNQQLLVNGTEDEMVELMAQQLTVAEVTFEPENDFVVIHLGDELVPGEEYQVSIRFVATLNDQLLGFYRSKYEHQGSERSGLKTSF